MNTFIEQHLVDLILYHPNMPKKSYDKYTNIVRNVLITVSI